MDKGHAKNAANLEDLNSHVAALGAAYNPSRNAIKYAQLVILLGLVKPAIAAVIAALTPWKKATNAREILYEPVKKLVTRLINALAATEASKQTIADARAYVRKMDGERAKQKENPPLALIDIQPVDAVVGDTAAKVADQTPEHQYNSASQQTYDLFLEHYSGLVSLLSAEPLYAPNEADLKITAITTVQTNMKAANTLVINTHTTLQNARITRNKLLYTDSTGVCDIALAVKKYVKSVFGASSPESKNISKIKFTKYKI